MTSNCAGQAAGCTVNSSTGFDVASFLLGLANTKTRNLFDAGTYTEKRPEYACYVAGRLPRDQQADAQPRPALGRVPALGRGRRPPVELRRDDRASSSWPPTTRRIDGVKVGRYLQTYSKGDFGPRLGFAYDLTGDGKTVVRGGFGMFWNFTPGGTSSSKAQNPPFLQSTALTPTPTRLRHQPAAQGRPAGASGRRSDAAGGRHDAVDFRHQLPRRLRRQVEPQRAAGARHATTWWRSPTSARRAGRCWSRGTRTRRRRSSGSPTRTSTVRTSRSRRPLRTIGQVAEQRHARLQRAAREVPAPVREQLLVPELVHLRARRSTSLRQRRHGHADQRLRSRSTTAARPTTTSRTRSRRAGSTSCRGPANKVYGGWQISGILLLRAGLPLTVTQTQGVQSTGTRQPSEPDLRRHISTTRRSTSGSTRAASWRRRTPPAPTATPAATSSAGPGQFNIDASLIKNTKIGRIDTEIRIEAFNLLNHPQFAQPEHDASANAAVRARSRRCCRARRARCAARSSGRCRSA